MNQLDADSRVEWRVSERLYIVIGSQVGFLTLEMDPSLPVAIYV